MLYSNEKIQRYVNTNQISNYVSRVTSCRVFPYRHLVNKYCYGVPIISIHPICYATKSSIIRGMWPSMKEAMIPAANNTRLGAHDTHICKYTYM